MAGGKGGGSYSSGSARARRSGTRASSSHGSTNGLKAQADAAGGQLPNRHATIYQVLKILMRVKKGDYTGALQLAAGNTPPTGLGVTGDNHKRANKDTPSRGSKSGSQPPKNPGPTSEPKQLPANPNQPVRGTKPTTPDSYFKPDPFAKGSIPARPKSQRFTNDERRK